MKGATALLARDLGVRGSLDIDLYRQVARGAADADLRKAATIDLHDWFRFGVGNSTPISNDAVRLPITTIVGGTTWAQFHVDLVGTNVRMTGEPDHVSPLVAGLILDVEQHGYNAYPLVDHVADKVAATYETYGTSLMPSTRYRDLVDLVAIITHASVGAAAQHAALDSELQRRGIAWPGETFDVPDRRLWEPGYAAEARRSLLHEADTLDQALDVVRPFIDPLLGRNAEGRWDPHHREWTNESVDA